jgi:hypothetical protein
MPSTFECSTKQHGLARMPADISNDDVLAFAQCRLGLGCRGISVNGKRTATVKDLCDTSIERPNLLAGEPTNAGDALLLT